MLQQTGKAGLTCRRCGISRPTLRKWVRRYDDQGEAGLHSQSRRPHTLRPCNVDADLKAKVLHLRSKRNLGPKRIQSELMRHAGVKRSTSTIYKVLKRAKVGALRRPRKKRAPKRYSLQTPGERVQIDSMQVASGLYQFTAIDDCTRYRVIGLYPNRSSKSARSFLVDRVLQEMPFPLQRVQTDRGGEFCSVAFHGALHDRKIKFRPTRARSPHLNGKVERSQLTDRVEFYALEDVPSEALSGELFKWQQYYNSERPRSSLGGKTPVEHWASVVDRVPPEQEIRSQYDEAKERYNIRPSRYYWVSTK